MTSPSDFKMMGVTPPISTEPPKPNDVQASESELFNAANRELS